MPNSSKNTVKDSRIKAKGNVIIGDIHYHMDQLSKSKSMNPDNDIVKTLETLVAAGKIKEAVSQMVDYFELKNPDIYIDGLQLSGRWEAMVRKELRGILSNADLNLERNQISGAVLELIDRLKR